MQPPLTLKTHRAVLISGGGIPNLDPAFITFDESGRVISVGINDPILYSEAAQAFMLKRGIKLIVDEPRKATITDIKAIWTFWNRA